MSPFFSFMSPLGQNILRERRLFNSTAPVTMPLACHPYSNDFILVKSFLNKFTGSVCIYIYIYVYGSELSKPSYVHVQEKIVYIEEEKRW